MMDKLQISSLNADLHLQINVQLFLVHYMFRYLVIIGADWHKQHKMTGGKM
jgi:hypothetical protein